MSLVSLSFGTRRDLSIVIMSNALVPDRMSPISQSFFEQSYGEPAMVMPDTRCRFLIISFYRRDAHLLHDHACGVRVVRTSGASITTDRRSSLTGRPSL